jgi:hypothetical protein
MTVHKNIIHTGYDAQHVILEEGTDVCFPEVGCGPLKEVLRAAQRLVCPINDQLPSIPPVDNNLG